MPLPLDLFLLETWQRFQHFCFYVARAEYSRRGAYVVQLGMSWDGGRDVVIMLKADGTTPVARSLALQAKFTRSFGSSTKRSILKSLEAIAQLDETIRPSKFILCMPLDPTGRFHDWLRVEMEQRKIEWEIWGRAELLARLEQHPDIVQTFFYPVFAELQQHFVVNDLELRSLSIDNACEWKQPDTSILEFSSVGTMSSDLVLDIIVRNRGTMEAVATRIIAQVLESVPVPRGLFPPGLLFPKITYAVSINNGAPGIYERHCDPPLLVEARKNQRFKLRLTETGCTWAGVVQVGIDYGDGTLWLPSIRLVT
jgi:hypothetical protein